MVSPKRDKQQAYSAGIVGPMFLLLAAAFLLFRETLEFGFISIDDGIHVYQNPRVLAPTLSQWVANWQAPWQGLYIPVTYAYWQTLSFWDQLFQSGIPRPSLYHALNVLLHALNAGWIFFIFKPLVGWGALFGAFLFLAHPIQVESVAWISGGKDVLSTFFALAAFFAHEKARRTGKWGYRAWTWALAVVAVLSKPSFVVLGVFLCLWDFFLERTTLRVAIKRAAIAVAVAVPFIWLTRYAQPSEIVEFIPTLAQRPWIAADAFLFYLGKLFFPFALSLDYGRDPQKVVADGFPWVLLFFSVLLILFIFRSPDRRFFLWSLLFLFLCLLPTAGFFPFYYQKYSTVADRFFYFAMFVPALAASFAWARVRPWQRAAALGVLILFASGTTKQIRVWKDDVSLYRQMVTVNPNALNYYNLARFMEESDPKHLSDSRIDGYYKEAIHLNPKYYRAYHNLGVRSGLRGESRRAMAYYRAAIDLAPLLTPESYNNIGVLYAEMGDYGEARRYFREALRVHPGFLDAETNLSLAKRFEETP